MYAFHQHIYNSCEHVVSFVHTFFFINVEGFLNDSSLSVGHYELCRDNIGGFTWKPRSSLTKEKTPMKLASGFCIPKPLSVHTGIKR